MTHLVKEDPYTRFMLAMAVTINAALKSINLSRTLLAFVFRSLFLTCRQSSLLEPSNVKLLQISLSPGLLPWSRMVSCSFNFHLNFLTVL